VLPSAAALLDSLFEHPSSSFSITQTPDPYISIMRQYFLQLASFSSLADRVLLLKKAGPAGILLVPVCYNPVP
jgi:hypothetical protein